MDHIWHGFYTGLKRFSRFPTVIPTGSVYDLKFKGTVPTNLVFELVGGSDNDYAIIKVHYNE